MYKEHQRCLISGSHEIKPLKGFEAHYLVKSKPVGFVFCSRVPTDDELEKHYNKYSRDDYFSPVTRARYIELLKYLEPYRKNGRILDVGCGIGFFLEVAREMGWDVYGTEYTENAISKCLQRGIKMKKGRLDSQWWPDGYFDVITSFEVIEHINDPIDEVSKINHLLRTGGIFYVTTPNFNAIERVLLKSKYSIIQYPEHLSYYTPKTLDFLLSNSGFRKIKIMTTGISVTRIKMAFGIKNHDFGMSTSSDEHLRSIAEKNRFVKAAKILINLILTFLGIGNAMKAIYVKN